MKVSKRALLSVPILVSLLVGIAWAAIAPFSQSFIFPGAGAGVSPNCSPVTTSSPTPSAGSSGTLVFECGTTSALAIIGPVTATPTFILTASTWKLAITVSTCVTNTTLTSGVSATLATGNYNYCVGFVNYPTTAPTLTVAWA